MVEQRSVRTIMFDAVGTLLFAKPNVVDVYHGLGATHGSRVTRDRVGDRFRTAVDLFHRRPGQGQLPMATSQYDEYRRWQSIVAYVFLDLSDTSDLFEALWNHFSKPEHWSVYDDVPATLQTLRDRGFQLGIASNFDRRLEQIAEQLKLQIPDEFVFHSAGLGVRKPAKDFFRRIERACDLLSHQLLLVGDSREVDYLAAEQAGWQAVWLRRGSGDDLESGQISDLHQLSEVIAAC